MTKTGVYLRSLIASWAGYGANIVVMFFLSPFVVHSLGNARYGLWSLLMAVTGYLGLVEIGVRVSTGRYVNYHLGRGENEQVSHVVNTSLAFYCLASLLVLAAALTVGQFFGAIFPRITISDPSQVRAILLLMALNVWLGLWSATFSQLLYANNRFDLLNAILVLALGVRAGGTVLVLRGRRAGGTGVGAGGLQRDKLRAAGGGGQVEGRARPLRLAMGEPGVLPEDLRLRGLVVRGDDVGQDHRLRQRRGDRDSAGGVGDRVLRDRVHAAGQLARVALLRGPRDDAGPPEVGWGGSGDGRADGPGHQRHDVRGRAAPGGTDRAGRGVHPVLDGKRLRKSATVLVLVAVAQFGNAANMSCGTILNAMGFVPLLAAMAALEAGLNLGLSVVLVKYFGMGIVGVAIGMMAPSLAMTGVVLLVVACRRTGIALGRYLGATFVRWGAATAVLLPATLLISRAIGEHGWRGFWIKAALMLAMYVPLGVGLVLGVRRTREMFGKGGRSQPQATDDGAQDAKRETAEERGALSVER